MWGLILVLSINKAGKVQKSQAKLLRLLYYTFWKKQVLVKLVDTFYIFLLLRKTEMCAFWLKKYYTTQNAKPTVTYKLFHVKLPCWQLHQIIFDGHSDHVSVILASFLSSLTGLIILIKFDVQQLFLYQTQSAPHYFRELIST